MSVTAQQLSKSGAKGKEIDAVVREQLLIIDDKLQRAERTWGRNILAHDLATAFNFPGLDKKDAQRIIYVAIIRSLEERGFTIRLLLEAERTVLFIEWVTDLNEGEVDAMNRLIQKVKIDAKDVGDFLHRNRGPAEAAPHPAMPGAPRAPASGATPPRR